MDVAIQNRKNGSSQWNGRVNKQPAALLIVTGRMTVCLTGPRTLSLASVAVKENTSRWIGPSYISGVFGVY
jgi:hypothetical protein